jgi:hypothetical protein
MLQLCDRDHREPAGVAQQPPRRAKQAIQVLTGNHPPAQARETGQRGVCVTFRPGLVGEAHREDRSTPRGERLGATLEPGTEGHAFRLQARLMEKPPQVGRAVPAIAARVDPDALQAALVGPGPDRVRVNSEHTCSARQGECHGIGARFDGRNLRKIRQVLRTAHSLGVVRSAPPRDERTAEGSELSPPPGQLRRRLPALVGSPQPQEQHGRGSRHEADAHHSEGDQQR